MLYSSVKIEKKEKYNEEYKQYFCCELAQENMEIKEKIKC